MSTTTYLKLVQLLTLRCDTQIRVCNISRYCCVQCVISGFLRRVTTSPASQSWTTSTTTASNGTTWPATTSNPSYAKTVTNSWTLCARATQLFVSESLHQLCRHKARSQIWVVVLCLIWQPNLTLVDHLFMACEFLYGSLWWQKKMRPNLANFRCSLPNIYLIKNKA